MSVEPDPEADSDRGYLIYDHNSLVKYMMSCRHRGLEWQGGTQDPVDGCAFIGTESFDDGPIAIYERGGRLSWLGVSDFEVGEDDDYCAYCISRGRMKHMTREEWDEFVLAVQQ